MNVAELAIRKGTVTWTLSIAVLVLGWFAYRDLPRLEDPEISSREARVVTPYPGASAAQVEREISDPIEQAVRGLAQVRRVESHSTRGLSIVKVVIQDRYARRGLSQILGDLRRRVDDLQPRLPPNAGPSVTNHDPGDRYGVYYALTGEGFTQAELKRVAVMLQRELTNIREVAECILSGDRQETVFVEISKTTTRSLGIGLEDVFDALRSKNLPADAGRIRVGPEQVSVYPSGIYPSEQNLGELLIAGDQDRLVRLDEIAEIRRGYEDPPRRLLRFDGRPAVGIAASTGTGGDTVALRELVKRKLAELTAQIPLGMELVRIAPQSDTASAAVDAFDSKLLQAAVIVMAALLLFMGLRGGLVVGVVALLTMAATFAVMDYFQIALDRVSLGALVIALGLLTDNAIVVVQGMKVRMDRGVTGIQAAREATGRTAVPLLAATAVAVLAFAAIGGMENGTGEYAGGLYVVVPVALTLSWMTAMTAAPLLADRLLKSAPPAGEAKAPAGSRVRRLYAGTVAAAIRHRWAVLGAASLVLATSVYGFGSVNRTYFPASAVPSFLMEVHFREGTHIRETERQMDGIQAYLRELSGVTQVATTIGDGHPIYLPSYGLAPDLGAHYAVGLVQFDDHRRVDETRRRAQAELAERFPDAVINLKNHFHGPQTAGGRIQLRISGPEPAELRRLADRVKEIIAADPDAKAVRDEWGAKVKVAHPILSEERARRLRIDRKGISDALRTAFSGTVTGFYRDGGELIPIVARAPKEERSEVEDMADIMVTSPLRGDKIPMLQLVDRLDTITEDPRRSRRDGLPTITVHADASLSSTFELLQRIKPRVEKALGVDFAAYLGRDSGTDVEIDAGTIPVVQDDVIPLGGRPGYYIGWGGEAEHAAESEAGLAVSLPVYFGLAALVVIALFNSLRQPLIVLLTVPLSLIGVTAGLLLTGRPFDFMSLLGVVALSGMLIKYAILLVDGIDGEIREGKGRLNEVPVLAGRHLRPVALASGTTFLAMTPLLRDDLFGSMAVTMTSGLGVAILLILVLVPTLYANLLPIGNDTTA